MKTKTIKFNDALWKKKVRDLARRVGVEEKPFVKEQAGLLARDLAKFAPPYAGFPSAKQSSIGKSKDKKAGEIAILADLQRIFFVPDNPSTIDWAIKKFKGGEIWTSGKITGSGIARNVSDMQKHHDKHRHPITGRTKQIKASERLWVKKTVFNRYYRSQKKNVGIAKASLAKVAVNFNPKVKSPAWVKRNFLKSSASNSLQGRKGKPTAIFKSKASGLNHIAGKTIRVVLNGRLKAMEKRLMHILKNSAKKSGLKVK